MALSKKPHSHLLSLTAVLLLTASLATHTAGAADAPTAPPTLLENDALRVYVGGGGQAALTEIYATKLNVGAGQCAATEAAVFADGQQVEITTFRLTKRAVDRLEFTTRLPANPLLGLQPKATNDLPFYPPDRTAELVLTKTYVLADSGPLLEIRYTVENTGKQRNGFCLGLTRRLADKGRKTVLYVPTEEGVLAMQKVDPQLYFPRRDGRYFYDLPGTWSGVVFDDLDPCLNLFAPSIVSCIKADRSSTQTITNRIELAPAQKWETVTRIAVLPRGQKWEMVTPTGVLQNTQEFVGARDGIVARIDMPPPPPPDRERARKRRRKDLSLEELVDKEDELLAPSTKPGSGLSEVKVDAVQALPAYVLDKPVPGRSLLWSARSRTVTARVLARRNLTHEEVELARRELVLSPHQTIPLPFTFTPKREGTWLLTTLVTAHGVEVARFERPIDVERPSGFWLPEPLKVPRVGEEFDRYRSHAHSLPGRFDPFQQVPVPSTEIAPPHQVYAKPLSGGPLKLALIIPWDTGREAVELMLRLDVDVRTALMGAHGYRDPLAKKEERRGRAPLDEVIAAKRVLNREPDVILMAGTYWDWLPREIRREILRQVENGASCILAPPLTLSKELEELQKKARQPQNLPVREARRAPRGKGAVYFYDANARQPGRYAAFAGSEESLENMCLTVLHAARRTEKLDFEVKPDGRAAYRVETQSRTEKALQGELALVARLDRLAQFPGVYRQSYQSVPFLVRPYRAYEDIARTTAKIDLAGGGRSSTRLQVPPLPGGRYRLFFILRDAEGKTVTWRSLTRTVKAPVRIENLTLSHANAVRNRVSYMPTDTLKASFALQAIAGAEGDYVVGLRGTDRAGRVLFDEQKPAQVGRTATAVEMTASLRRTLHRMAVVSVQVTRNNVPIAEARAPLFVQRAPEHYNRFRFILLDNELNFPFTHVKLDDQVGPYSPLTFSWLDMRVLPFGGLIEKPIKDQRGRANESPEAQKKRREIEQSAAEKLGEFGLDGAAADPLAGEIEKLTPKKAKEEPVFIRYPCFNDPRHRAEKAAQTERLIKRYSVIGPQRILLVDEYFYGSANICHCAYCHKAYQGYLKETYGTLDALNRSWGTRYREWTDAEIYVIDKDFTPPETEEWPRAYDMLRYMGRQMIDFAQMIRNVGKQVDSAVEFGFSGVYKMTPFNGMDFWQMSQIGKYHVLYRDLTEWQSFAGPSAVTTWSSGYGRTYNLRHQEQLPWSLLLSEHFGTGHFTAPSYPMARPDATLWDPSRRYFEEFEQVRRGPAELLLGHKTRDPVAIHWSAPSFYVYGLEWWLRSKQYGRFERRLTTGGSMMDWPRRTAHTMFGIAARSRNIRPYYVAYGQLENGGFGRWGRPKVLILTYSTAISDKEAQMMRRFVREGGILIGQVNTATRDTHAKLLDKPLLDDLFGIRRTGPFAMAVMKEKDDDRTTRATVTVPGSDQAIEFSPLVVGPPNIAPTTATPHGRWGTDQHGGPILLVNRFGKGTAVYTNFLTMGVNEITGVRSDTATQRAAQEILNWATGLAGIRPVYETASEDGHEARFTITRFTDGHAFYLGAQTRWGMSPAWYESAGGTVRLTSGPRHVYHMRTGASLGHVDKFRIDFTPADTIRIYSCLPYGVSGLSLTPRPAALAAGETAQIDILLETGDARPERHVVRVDVTGPDGKPLPAHGQNVTLVDGRGTARIHTALNAPPGRWAIMARDVATGTGKQTEIDVRPR